MPNFKKWMAKLCRNTCGVTVFPTPAFAADFLTIRNALSAVYFDVFLPSNK